MGQYACIDGNGFITNIIVADSPPDVPDCQQVLPFEPGMGIGKHLVDGEWVFPPDETLKLSITLDKETVSQNMAVNATAQVKQGDNLAPVTGTYYVPIIRQSDGFQAKLLKVEFQDGEAQTSFSLSEPGIYKIELQKVYPKPQSELSSSPILIVEET